MAPTSMGLCSGCLRLKPVSGLYFVNSIAVAMLEEHTRRTWFFRVARCPGSGQDSFWVDLRGWGEWMVGIEHPLPKLRWVDKEVGERR